jgi:peroxiredoxin
MALFPFAPLESASNLCKSMNGTGTGKSLGENSSGIRFLGNPSGAFTRALGLEFEASPVLGTNRSKRYAIVVENGKLQSMGVEPVCQIISASVSVLRVRYWVR